MKEPFIAKEDELHTVASGIISTLSNLTSPRAKVIFLEGDLGAGKTTFTKELASVLGITKEDVHSPTFILKKEYTATHHFFKKLIHIDAYRFDTPKEASVLGLPHDLEHHDTLIVIEWPSKMGDTFTEDMTLSFSVVDDDTREIVVNYAGGHMDITNSKSAHTLLHRL